MRVDDAEMVNDSLRTIRSVADVQFGSGTGKTIFPDGVDVSFSRRTGRIRHVYLSGTLLATRRPTDGFFSLTIEGAQRMLSIKASRLSVEVEDDVADFIAEGRSVFAKHVVDCDENIRSGEEVVVVNSQRKLLAVGRAVLTGEEMRVFQNGVAVRVRQGTLNRRKGKTKKEK